MGFNSKDIDLMVEMVKGNYSSIITQFDLLKTELGKRDVSAVKVSQINRSIHHTIKALSVQIENAIYSEPPIHEQQGDLLFEAFLERRNKVAQEYLDEVAKCRRENIEKQQNN